MFCLPCYGVAQRLFSSVNVCGCLKFLSGCLKAGVLAVEFIWKFVQFTNIRFRDQRKRIKEKFRAKYRYGINFVIASILTIRIKVYNDIKYLYL